MSRDLQRLCHFIALFVAFFFCFVLSRLEADDPTIVQTQAGLIKGVIENGYRAFRGIPYAEPPVNALRWKPPIPKKSWAPSVRSATEFGPCCPQRSDLNDHYPMSEDCLFINVYTPLPHKRNFATSLYPVMVFIHGGAFVVGCSSQSLFWGDYFANTTDVIFVSFNYRLSALGFLYTGNDITGNYGILDQILALQWVKANIQNFGGDPNNILLFGQSAGAMSIAIHLTSPYSFANRYFHKAILESDPFTIQYRTPQESMQYAETFAIYLGCFVNDTKCLRSKSATQIIEAASITFVIPRKFFSELLQWEPTVDGVLVLDQPLNLLRSGKYYSVPTIIGTTQNETLIFVHIILETLKLSYLNEWEYMAIVLGYFDGQGGFVLERYPAQRDSTVAAIMASTDYIFRCSSRFAALSMALHNTQVYVYEFLHAPMSDPTNNDTWCQRGEGVCHNAELPYVFHSIGFIPGYYQTQEEQQLSWKMLKYWSDFAKIPVSERQMPQSLRTGWILTGQFDDWPPFNRSLYSLAFNVPDISVLQRYNAANCDMWDAIGYMPNKLRMKKLHPKYLRRAKKFV